MVTHNILRATYEEILLFSEEKNSKFVTTLDLNKCLKGLNSRIHCKHAHFIFPLPSNKVPCFRQKTLLLPNSVLT